jgi:hypothetical protein
MNRLAKLTCWLMIAEMLVVATCAVAARWPDIAHHREAISFFNWRVLFGLWFLPAVLAYTALRIERRLRPEGMRLSADHHRLTEVGLVAVSLFFGAMQAWLAAIFVFRDPAVLHIGPQGVGILLLGAFLVIYGNASAKRSPPVGPAAPDPGVWIRASLRSGWTMVLLGICMMAAAFAPGPVRMISVLVVMPVSMLFMYSQRRLMRGGAGPRTPA